MPELIAKGTNASQQWRRLLVEGETVRLGRAPTNGWGAAWDSQISREHVELVWRAGRLEVRCLDAARNPVFYHGQPAQQFAVLPGEHFVIGSTSFAVADDSATVSLQLPAPREQHTFRPGDLRRIQFRNADHRLEILSQLPQLITESTSDEMCSVRLVNLLLAGIPDAEAAAIVCRTEPVTSHSGRGRGEGSGEGASTSSSAQVQTSVTSPSGRGRAEGPGEGASASSSAQVQSSVTSPSGRGRAEGPGEGASSAPFARQVKVLQWDRRRDAVGRFQPSQRLILEALDRGESVLHVWSDLDAAEQSFTITENLDWAFCTPVPGEACRGWALYVAGSSGLSPLPAEAGQSLTAERQGDLRFAELVAELVGALRQVRRLEGQRAVLSNFLPPMVLQAISGDKAEQALAPRETDVTVLFCDLRGFSREAEQWREKLEALLHRVSEALGVMTHFIVKHGGAIGDFQGDAAMGFWGLPLPPPDGPLQACLAALDIRAEFQRAASQPGHPLADFRVGIGIAHGRAVAGRIGTADHMQLTVFGPVANLASRLESMTKFLRVPILLDEPTAEYVRQHLPPQRGRCRRLGRVRPYGMELSLMVSELLPSAEQDPTLSDKNVADFDAAIDALLAGRWTDALEYLHEVPAKDRAKDFLTIFIVQNNYEPPPHWDGVIPMPSK